jgi:hypothetical protein
MTTVDAIVTSFYCRGKYLPTAMPLALINLYVGVFTGAMRMRWKRDKEMAALVAAKADWHKV